jgi:aminoglycoside phosphotransferase family enzyme/predicted kinase
MITPVSDSDLQAHVEPALFEHKDRLTRSDLWAWRDAVDRLARPIASPKRDGAVDSDLGHIVEAMSDPAFYPGAPAVEVRETHISWVFLAGPRAYKLKKPLVLPFLDYGSVEHRRAMCEHEVELNQRLAAGVYLGVRAIVDRDGRLQLGPPGPDAIEHVVEMRRFDEAETLAAMVLAGRATAEIVAAVGRRLASFHAEAPPCRIGEEVLAGVERVADGNFEALLSGVGALAHPRLFAAQRFADAFVAGHAATLAVRAASGRVREGHGDLRAEHVLIGDGVRVVDCVEFDVELRTVDVGADLAFLVMDLARLGRPDLGHILVDAYRHAGGDPGSDELIAFHAAIRAWVRAKLAVPPESGARTPPQEQTAAQEEALELFALGERFAWQARLPLTLIVCGPPASGKSELARRLSEVSGLAVIGSDETRKQLSGLEPASRAPQEAYSAAATVRTYAELGRRAATQLGVSGGAIVDATFARRSARQAFSAACVGLAAPLVFECRAPAAVMQARARTREADPQHVSDAGPETAARLRRRFEPLEDDVPAARHFVLRTDQPVASIVEDVTTMLDRRLAEPPPPRPLDATRRSL